MLRIGLREQDYGANAHSDRAISLIVSTQFNSAVIFMDCSPSRHVRARRKKIESGARQAVWQYRE
jgi:hypothetical protein